ncbi:MAG: hypothetical protein JSV35_07895 [Candidatus Bathyarchaeota archaeon]|nr:MAG: hypothetical protein JSV35_07895 [Candidatus Bathyarchaeota archaeon]
MAKPWQTKGWKERRERFLKEKVCEVCGASDGLVIHHPQHFRGLREYRRTANQFLQGYFANGKHHLEKRRLYAKAQTSVSKAYFLRCPSCSARVYPRKTLKPKYRCRGCGLETNRPSRKPPPSTRQVVHRRFRSFFFKRHGAQIRELFRQKKMHADTEYLAFTNVTILCRRCHYATEKGLTLCKTCGKRFHYPKYQICSECHIQTTQVQENTHKVVKTEPISVNPTSIK